jgi:hypothetical protein
MSDGWDLTGIPPWLWPYVRNAQIGEAQIAAGVLASMIALKQVAPRLQGELGAQFAEAVGSAVADFEDEYCGTPPRPRPILSLVGELASFAHALPEGSAIRSDALGIASGLAERALKEG